MAIWLQCLCAFPTTLIVGPFFSLKAAYKNFHPIPICWKPPPPSTTKKASGKKTREKNTSFFLPFQQIKNTEFLLTIKGGQKNQLTIIPRRGDEELVLLHLAIGSRLLSFVAYTTWCHSSVSQGIRLVLRSPPLFPYVLLLLHSCRRRGRAQACFCL